MFDTESVVFQRGFNSESVIADCFRKDGFYVVITADLKERGRPGAPGARNNNEFITLPDLDVGKNGYRGFVEVKYKTEPNYTRKTGRYEHGIGLKKWGMYKQAQYQFGTTVFLCIHEGKSGAVLIATLEELEPLKRIYSGDKMDPGGMVFFPRASFGLWGQVTTVSGQIPLDISIEGTDGKLFKVVRHKQYQLLKGSIKSQVTQMGFPTN